LVSEVQTDILENEHNSDSALKKACNTSDANKVAQYKKTMEQQITELNLQLVEMSTKPEYTTGKMNETENELRDKQIELYNTMKQLVDTINECSFYEEQIEEMRIQNLRSHNELSEYKNFKVSFVGLKQTLI
jgi:HPt (histidine-containing phosphotransfer) domain-containing protein